MVGERWQATAPLLPRTPLRNIGNCPLPSGNASELGNPGQRMFVCKNVLALRGHFAAGVGPAFQKMAPQVHGKAVFLATSPMQAPRCGLSSMHSPMVGRTPEDIRREAKRERMPHSPGVALNMSHAFVPAAPVSTAAHHASLISPVCAPSLQSAHPVFYNQLNLHCPSQFQAHTINETTIRAPNFHVHVPLDPTQEAARIKKAEAKAKREAKAALKAEQEALRLLHEQRVAEHRTKLLVQQNAAVLEAIAVVEEEDSSELNATEAMRTVPWELVAVGQSLITITKILSSRNTFLYPVDIQQIEEALSVRKTTLEHENVLAALHSSLLAAARGDTMTTQKNSSRCACVCCMFPSVISAQHRRP